MTLSIVKNKIIFLSLIIVVALELLHRVSQAADFTRVIHVPSIVAVTLLVAVMYTAFSAGKRIGLLSSIISIAYLSYFYSSPDQLFHYTPENLRRVVVAGLSLLLIGWVVGTLRERTEQLLEKERQARRRAEIAEKEKDEFLGLVSHELKTPLTSLKAFVQLLEMRFAKLGDRDTARHLDKMDTQLNKLNLLIADIYDITKVETGKLYVSKDFFRLDALVKEVVEEIQQITDKRISVKNLRGMSVYGDKKRIGQVLSNLLMNAIKYAPAVDKIIMSMEIGKNSVRVSVQDFGEGIEKEKQKKIFEKFYQNEQRSGLGLGLYISSEIIKLHKGRIWVKSEKGKGSTFSFSLPVRGK